MTDTLATKQDLHELDTRIDAGFVATKQDLRQLETRLDARLREVETRFTQVDARFEYLEKTPGSSARRARKAA